MTYTAYLGDFAIKHTIKIRKGGMLCRQPLKPAITLPIELYSKERQAEFLLSNAVSDEDYAIAKKEVLAMEVEPEKIKHYKFSEKSKSKHHKTSGTYTS